MSNQITVKPQAGVFFWQAEGICNLTHEPSLLLAQRPLLGSNIPTPPKFPFQKPSVQRHTGERGTTLQRDRLMCLLNEDHREQLSSLSQKSNQKISSDPTQRRIYLLKHLSSLSITICFVITDTKYDIATGYKDKLSPMSSLILLSK